jgi:hypothetical protein
MFRIFKGVFSSWVDGRRDLTFSKYSVSSMTMAQEYLTLSHMASEVLFTIWQGGQLTIPVKTTLKKINGYLGPMQSALNDLGIRP